ncbi:MAG TPA: response regulator [Cyclobacteriaceae bacterium]
MHEGLSMDISGPIVLVDDDEDDHEIFAEAFRSIGIDDSLIRSFYTCSQALQYLEATSEKPFIIICDLNLPLMNGLEFRRKINENEYLRRKSIPFVFLSTATQPTHVTEAYDLTVQGFFVKPASFNTIQKSFRLIFEYWNDCIHPNSVI